MERALSLFKDKGDRRSQALCLYELSMIHHARRDNDASLATAEQSLKLCRQLGDRFASVYVLSVLGRAQMAAGHHEAACHSWQEAGQIAAQIAVETGGPHPEAGAVARLLRQHGCR